MCCRPTRGWIWTSWSAAAAPSCRATTTDTTMRPLIAIDWGTSSLRGARLGETCAILEERSSASGLLSVAPGEFPAVLERHFGDWLKARDVLCLMSGMV